jgi:hypothetical protein
VDSIWPRAVVAWSGLAAMVRRAAPAWTTITLTEWATTSCSSRAIRPRSSATAQRERSSCSVASWLLSASSLAM